MISLQEIDDLLGAIAVRAGVPKHCVELSFSRTSKDAILWPDVVIHMGVLPGMSKQGCKANGSGVTIEEAIDEAIRNMDTWRQLSANEVAAKKRRRKAKS